MDPSILLRFLDVIALILINSDGNQGRCTCDTARWTPAKFLREPSLGPSGSAPLRTSLPLRKNPEAFRCACADAPWEDIRDAITAATLGASAATVRQYTLRIKSLLSYGHDLGYMPFNAGVRIKVQSDAGNRGASLAERIMTPAEVALLIRAARTKRDCTPRQRPGAAFDRGPAGARMHAGAKCHG